MDLPKGVKSLVNIFEPKEIVVPGQKVEQEARRLEDAQGAIKTIMMLKEAAKVPKEALRKVAKAGRKKKVAVKDSLVQARIDKFMSISQDVVVNQGVRPKRKQVEVEVKATSASKKQRKK